jgi:hypoxanthine phosphoribosyltransferase
MEIQIRETLLTEEQIATRVGELARQISADFAHAEEVLLVGVLRGAFIFLADLVRQLTIPARIDFIAVSSYEGTTRASGAVRLIMDLRLDISGRHVILVEDIVDTGYTLDYLLETLSARRPASLSTCALVRKPESLRVDVPMDYLGFDIPDRWVVGYGLDCFDQHRALPYIAEVIPPDAPTT